jgi:hypothetical protein
MHPLVPTLAAAGLLTAAAFAQQAAPALTGFPFQNETLKYNLKLPTGVSLGDAAFSATRTASGWSFETTLTAGIPSYQIQDTYRSTGTTDLCSTELVRNFSHGSKKTSETTTFDQAKGKGERVTTLPPNGGRTEFPIPSCARDAVAFVYLVRREMGQGRVAPAQTVFFGAGYSVNIRYTGESKLPSGVADHVVAEVKGPSSGFAVEIDFARDAARTPLLLKVPLPLGNLSVELVR